MTFYKFIVFNVKEINVMSDIFMEIVQEKFDQKLKRQLKAVGCDCQ